MMEDKTWETEGKAWAVYTWNGFIGGLRSKAERREQRRKELAYWKLEMDRIDRIERREGTRL